LRPKAEKKKFCPFLHISKFPLLICGFSSLLLLGTVSAQAAGLSQSMAECATIENDAERLKCYDQLAGRSPEAVKEVTESTGDESTEKTPK